MASFVQPPIPTSHLEQRCLVRLREVMRPFPIRLMTTEGPVGLLDPRSAHWFPRHQLVALPVEQAEVEQLSGRPPLPEHHLDKPWLGERLQDVRVRDARALRPRVSVLSHPLAPRYMSGR